MLRYGGRRGEGDGNPRCLGTGEGGEREVVTLDA